MNGKRRARAIRKSGRTHEEYVLLPLKLQHGFKVWTYKRWEAACREKKRLPSRIIVRDMPFTTIYGTQGKTEFWLRATDAAPAKGIAGGTPEKPLVCRIECKNQEASGSIDEKLPYLVMTLENFPEEDIILAAHIPGARVGAQEWLKKAIRNRELATEKSRSKRIILLSGDTEENTFRSWAYAAFHKDGGG